MQDLQYTFEKLQDFTVQKKYNIYRIYTTSSQRSPEITRHRRHCHSQTRLSVTLDHIPLEWVLQPWWEAVFYKMQKWRLASRITRNYQKPLSPPWSAKINRCSKTNSLRGRRDGQDWPSPPKPHLPRQPSQLPPASSLSRIPSISLTKTIWPLFIYILVKISRLLLLVVTILFYLHWFEFDQERPKKVLKS